MKCVSITAVIADVASPQLSTVGEQACNWSWQTILGTRAKESLSTAWSRADTTPVVPGLLAPRVLGWSGLQQPGPVSLLLSGRSSAKSLPAPSGRPPPSTISQTCTRSYRDVENSILPKGGGSFVACRVPNHV